MDFSSLSIFREDDNDGVVLNSEGFLTVKIIIKKTAQCSVEDGPRCYMKWRLRLASLLFIRFGKVTQGYVKINSLILQLSMLYL